MKKYLGSIWFWWIFLTIIYLSLYWSYLYLDEVETVGGHIAGLVSLFVPFGLREIILAFFTFPFSVISMVVAFGGAYFFQKWLSQKSFTYFYLFF